MQTETKQLDAKIQSMKMTACKVTHMFAKKTYHRESKRAKVSLEELLHLNEIVTAPNTLSLHKKVQRHFVQISRKTGEKTDAEKL